MLISYPAWFPRRRLRIACLGQRRYMRQRSRSVTGRWRGRQNPSTDVGRSSRPGRGTTPARVLKRMNSEAGLPKTEHIRVAHRIFVRVVRVRLQVSGHVDDAIVDRRLIGRDRHDELALRLE